MYVCVCMCTCVLGQPHRRALSSWRHHQRERQVQGPVHGIADRKCPCIPGGARSALSEVPHAVLVCLDITLSPGLFGRVDSVGGRWRGRGQWRRPSLPRGEEEEMRQGRQLALGCQMCMRGCVPV